MDPFVGKGTDGEHTHFLFFLLLIVIRIIILMF